jgi:hypothetical protein
MAALFQNTMPDDLIVIQSLLKLQKGIDLHGAIELFKNTMPLREQERSIE